MLDGSSCDISDLYAICLYFPIKFLWSENFSIYNIYTYILYIIYSIFPHSLNGEMLDGSSCDISDLYAICLWTRRFYHISWRG